MSLGYDNPSGYAVPDEAPARNDEFELLPWGWQPVRLDAVYAKENGAGWRAQRVQLRVTGGDFNGRVIFAQHTTHHGNPESGSIAIGRRQISSMLAAVSQPQCDDLGQLIGYEFDANVTVDKAKGNYPASNSVRAYAPPGTHPPTPRPAPKATQPAAPSARADEAAFMSDDDMPF